MDEDADYAEEGDYEEDNYDYEEDNYDYEEDDCDYAVCQICACETLTTEKD